MAAIPVSWFNSVAVSAKASLNILKTSRCPDSCMLEKITTSPPFCCTASTKATYFFLVVGSLALDKNICIFVDEESSRYSPT